MICDTDTILTGDAKMNVKNINIKDIRPYKNNAKKHDETQIVF